MGFVDEYVAFAQEITDAPPIFHTAIAYSILGAHLGTSAWIRYGIDRLYPNLWVLLIGDSSFMRKSTSLRIGQTILHAANPDRILPSQFSLEKCLELLEAKPAGLMIFYEFMALMGLLERDYMAGMKAVLCELFDCPPSYSRETKGRTVRIDSPCLSILTATTTEWFIERVTESDFRGGLIPRFLIVPARSKPTAFPFPPPASAEKKNALIMSLHATSCHGEIPLTPAALAFYSEWATPLMNGAFPSFLSPFVSRLTTVSLKIALLDCINAHAPSVSPSHILKGITLCDDLWASFSLLYETDITFTPYQKKRKAVLRFLSHETRISRSELLRKTRLSLKELDHILLSLLEEKTISAETTHTHGRPATFYRLRFLL